MKTLYNKIKHIALNAIKLLPLGGLGGLLTLGGVGLLTSCSDDPDNEYYYTYSGEMMSEYLKSHEQFSEFAAIVDRADLMKSLSAYGHYTCFAPTNDAVDEYLKAKGKSKVDELSDADCDTIARTHLVNNIYTVADMPDGTLTTSNMNGNFIEITHGTDEESRGVVFLNRSANIIFDLQDDSVQNGIVQPINGVLKATSSMLPDVIKANPRISIFYQALCKTGLKDSLLAYRDENYDASSYNKYKYISHVNKEIATVPDDKKQGFTAFIPTDSILKAKYGIETVEQLYAKACEIYDAVYPDDANTAAHEYDNATDRTNPLNRLVSYSILTRDVIGYNFLTPLGDICILTTDMNPEDWYETLLPHTMMKFSRLTVLKDVSQTGALKGEYYVNHRYDRNDASNNVLGQHVIKTVEEGIENASLNGRYFYVDDIVAFSETTRDVVDNCRIRMDFSTIFPELMTMNIRLNGNAAKADEVQYDESGKYGRNYYFPDGYLKNVKITINGEGEFVYRRPHDWYDSYEGDEMNLFGNYDFTFKLPPVPYEGDWQVRLGFAVESTRGIAQIYLDGEPQGIPLDMTKSLDDPSIMGSSFKTTEYKSFSDAQKASDQKELKNKGYYRGAMGGQHHQSSHDGAWSQFGVQNNTIRRVLCTKHLDPNVDHYLRIRSVSTKMGNNNEFDLDYLELVPKAVYDVTGTGTMEDDL